MGEQKARPVPLHLQEDVVRELEKLLKTGHLDEISDMNEDCFVSPVVITVKSDKSVKIALDARKLNDSCIKMRPHMPNMEELFIQISVQITRDRTVQLFISEADLDYTSPTDETIRKKQADNAPSQLPGEYLADITDSKKSFWSCRHTHDIPRKNRPNTRLQHTSLARQHNCSNPGEQTRTR